MRLPLEPLFSRTGTIFCLQCLLLHWRVYPSFGLPLITATTAVVLPSGGLEVMGVLWLICISLLWLDDVTVMSSALLNVKGLLYVVGMLGVAGSLNVAELQRIAGLLKVAQSLTFAESWSWLAKRCWIGDVLIASNLLITNNIAITSWFRGGSFNRNKGSKLVPFNGLI